MAKCGTNTEVIKAYFSGDSEPYKNSRDTLYFTRNILYSYGGHFPLAVDLGDCYMLNGDRYSITTSQHQSSAHSYVGHNKANKPYFTTSISAISRAQESVLGFHEPNFSKLKVLDKIDDLYKYGQDAVDFLNSGFDLFGITIRYEKNPTTSKREVRLIHRPGAVLFKIRKTYWLAGMDDESYFVSRLCKRVKTVKEAFESLKPKKVKYIENTGINVKRQGEWFFIPLKMEKKDSKKMYENMRPNFVLPRESMWSNPHTATRGFNRRNQILVSGQVRHPEHPMLKLSTLKDIEIFQAVKNTSLENFSAQGVD